jgi:hypothetical protein
VFHVNGQVKGDKVGVVVVEQITAQTTQAEANYISDDDLEEMTNMLTDL